MGTGGAGGGGASSFASPSGVGGGIWEGSMAASPLLVHTLHRPSMPALMTHLSAITPTVFTAPSCACARCASVKDRATNASCLAQKRS